MSLMVHHSSGSSSLLVLTMDTYALCLACVFIRMNRVDIPSHSCYNAISHSKITPGIKRSLTCCSMFIRMNIGERVFISQPLTLPDHILLSALQFAPSLPSCLPVLLPVHSNLQDLGAVRSAYRSSSSQAMYCIHWFHLLMMGKQLPASLIQLSIYTHWGPFYTTIHCILQPIME